MYKLTYFDTKGRAEVIRLLLVLAGVTFEDNRIQRGDWPAIKPTTPFGQVPVLEHDGKMLAQTVPILCYLGQQHGFCGEDAFQKAQVLSMCEATNDLATTMRAFATGRNTKISEFTATAKLTLGHFERFITQNGNNNFTIGNKITTADVCVFNAIDQLLENQFINTTTLEEIPRVSNVYETIKNNEKIAAYLVTRKN